MVETLSPGVYIEEIDIGPKPIEGVSTSTVAFIGRAKDGPILEPTFVDSWSTFESTFGGLINSPIIYLGYAVDAFFRNGGKRAYIVRVATASAAKASHNIKNGSGNDIINVSALKVGKDGENIKFTIKDSTISGEVKVFQKTVNVTSTDDPTKKKIIVEDSTGFEEKDKVHISDKEKTISEIGTIKSINGKEIELVDPLQEDYSDKNVLLRTSDISAGDKELKLENTRNFFKGSIVKISKNNTTPEFRRVNEVQGKKISFDPSLNNDYKLDSQDVVSVTSMEFDLILENGSKVESFPYLSIDPENPNYFVKKVNSTNAKVTRIDPPGSSDSVEKNLPKAMDGPVKLEGGKDDDIYDQGVDLSNGLAPLERYQGISLLAIPGETSQAVQKAMIEHCEIKMPYRFAILDSVRDEDVRKQKESLDSKKGYAALYYPWLQVVDPVSKENIYLPPSGMVAGIYARSDGQRGVHKAPANETVAGVIGLKKLVTKGEHDELNPAGINVIRYFPGRGIRVWGARTVASDPLWKYVNVRRLFIFLEESIDRATQWVVFEPNNEKLWARIKATITQFLTDVWKDGALMGTKPEEAFFVKCDRTTMTQNDIDNGKLVVMIGVAPVKPAEFVIFRIAQWAGGSAATE